MSPSCKLTGKRIHPGDTHRWLDVVTHEREVYLDSIHAHRAPHRPLRRGHKKQRRSGRCNIEGDLCDAATARKLKLTLQCTTWSATTARSTQCHDTQTRNCKMGIARLLL